MGVMGKRFKIYIFQAEYSCFWVESSRSLKTAEFTPPEGFKILSFGENLEGLVQLISQKGIISR